MLELVISLNNVQLDMPVCFQNPGNGQWAVVKMAFDLVVPSKDSEY